MFCGVCDDQPPASDLVHQRPAPMTAEPTVEVACAPDTARERARALIAGSGRVIEDPNGADDGSVWGIAEAISQSSLTA
jgi:hypothetical protein